ncbi:MAG TPA: TetR/AcrR family transcriptional regulator [Terracidiphilus sp.]|nr:TetR/AcrR family transcriptional regulator [Terracidiphilus sp.]
MPSSTASKIAAAARHILIKEGADAVTMRRVAAAVGITAMALYRHYPDRAGLLNSIADEGFEELAGRISALRLSGDLEARLTAVLDIYIDHALENPKLFELMFLKPRAGARRFPRDFKAGASPTANLASALIEQGMKSGYFRKDDPWEITFELGALLEGMIMLYLGDRTTLSAAQFRALCYRSFRRYFHGIRS